VTTSEPTTPGPDTPADHTPVFQAPDFDSPQPQQAERACTPPAPGSRPLLVVDAANVIGSRPDGWWKDRAGAARRLLTNLTTYQEGPGADTDITVILEGAARPAADAITPNHPLQVVLAPHSGDDTIVDVVADAATESPAREITVVTADRGLRARVEPLGAQTTGPSTLYALLDPQ
jgi:predicted RNA-binding protein with PIN domain